jgi:hypothetical protein
VRAALCNDLYTAEFSRRHNDANVLSIGARVVGEGWPTRSCGSGSTTDFEGGRHQRRIDEITAARERRDPVTSPTPSRALTATDPAIADIIRRETQRQNTTIQLIASENFTSPAVLAARARCSRTSTPRAIRPSATTAGTSS